MPKAIEQILKSENSLILDVQKKNVEALASPDDCELAETIAKADTQVQALLRERNITRLDLVACDPWSGENRHIHVLGSIMRLASQTTLTTPYPMIAAHEKAEKAKSEPVQHTRGVNISLDGIQYAALHQACLTVVVAMQ